MGDANAAHTPSPVCLNSQPPCASIALHNTSSWAASAARISSASASHRRVEPSTSVNKNVTTPEGAAATGADTPAAFHKQTRSYRAHRRNEASSAIGVDTRCPGGLSTCTWRDLLLLGRTPVVQVDTSIRTATAYLTEPDSLLVKKFANRRIAIIT